MTKKQRNILALSIDPDLKEKLALLALKYGCRWGDQANLSEFISKIASGEIPLCTPEQLDQIHRHDREIQKIHEQYRQAVYDLNLDLQELIRNKVRF